MRWGAAIILALAFSWTVLCFLLYSNEDIAWLASLPIWIGSGVVWIALYYPVSIWKLARVDRNSRNPRKGGKQRRARRGNRNILIFSLLLVGLLLGTWWIFQSSNP